MTHQSDVTGSDFFESLTGFEEIAIKKSFGKPIESLRREPLTFLRALVFADYRRNGVKDPQAKDDALALTIGATTDYFQPEPDEDPAAQIDGEDSDDEGKG